MHKEKETLFFDGKAYFENIKLELDQAKDKIFIEMYIFYPWSSPGKEILEILAKKRHQGLKIKILVDGMGSYEGCHFLSKFCLDHDIEFRIYNPTFWQYLRLYGDEGGWLKKIANSFIRLNSRNHKKCVIIDSKNLFLGSYNFTSEHLPKPLGQDWMDAGLHLQGDSVALAEYLFETSWNRYDKLARLRFYLTYRKLPVFKNSPLRFNPTYQTRRLYYRDLLLRIKWAKDKIVLVTPYLNPPWGFIRTLTKCARRGVPVTLITSAKSDVFFYRFLPAFFYQTLSRFGIKVMIYHPKVLHSKIVNIDDWYTVGSTNLNHRSIFHDLEVDAVIRHPQNKTLLDQYFHSLKEDSFPFKESIHLPFYHRMIAQIIFWVRYWL